MCTLSIIPVGRGGTFERRGFRAVVNRDELRLRQAALRPAVVDLDGGVRAAWPTDCHAGGTWVAASATGLALCLLNGNPTPTPALPADHELTSRGLIIPALVGAMNAEVAIERAMAEFELRRFAPFRLVAIDRDSVIDAFWDRARVRVTRRGLRPVCFVSSGLGDSRVAPRADLFRREVARHGATSAMQDRFHAHTWPERPEVSVMMSRAEARTVSVTTIEVVDGSPVGMDYADDAGWSRVVLGTEVLACEEPRAMAPLARGGRGP